MPGIPPYTAWCWDGDDVMDEYEVLVRSLVTERFTQWRPRSSHGGHLEHFLRASADTCSLSNSLAPAVSARVHYGKSCPEARDVK